MFDVLRKRLAAVSGMRVCSFEDLQNMDVDSVDSICLSDMLSSLTTSSDKPLENIDRAPLHHFDQNDNIEHYCKRKVCKIIKCIKKMEDIQKKGAKKMGMLVFFDLLRDQQYNHVSMSLLGEFMRQYRMVPKHYYLHYYMFFLHYGMYYHHTRLNVDVIDEKMKQMHSYHLRCIKLQLKYLQYIINYSRTH